MYQLGQRFRGPAYGPRPRLALDDSEATDLLQELRFLASDPVKQKSYHRWLVYSEKYQALVKDQIDTTHHDHEIRRRICNHIDVGNNLALDISNAVCNVWKHSSVSHIHVEGASDTQNAALRKLLDESHFHRHARSWNREAFLLGPVTVVPVIRGERLVFETLLPHFYGTIDNPDNLWGSPLAVAWDVSEQSRVPNTLAAYGGETTAILLDADSWRYYKAGGGEQGATSAPQYELIASVPHGIGEFPGSTLDFDISHGATRWECERHQRLIDATIRLGGIDAVLGFIRKSQNKRLITFLGNLDGVPAGQVQDPEKGIVGRTKSPQSVQIDVLDLDLDPENSIKQQAWIMQTIARSYGGQVASRPGSTSLLEAEIAFSHESLTEQRNEQIPFAVDFTRELLAKSVATCKAQRHPLYLDLPEPDAIREGLLVKYPPLSRSFASVDEQIKWQDNALSRGLVSFEDLLRHSMPGASEEELSAHIKENLEKQAPLITLMTTRDQSMAPPASETDSQRNGRQGPQVRDSETEE